MGKETNSSLDTITEQQSSIFHLTYFFHTAPQNLLYCVIFNISPKDEDFSFQDLYIQRIHSRIFTFKQKYVTNS